MERYNNRYNRHFKKKPVPTSIKAKSVDGSIEWIPEKNNPTDSGFDIKARCFVDQDGGEHNSFILEPDERVLVKSGFMVELRPGWEAQIRSRSGLALKNGIFVLNSPGTVDSGYRNEIGVILVNIGNEDVELNKGDRVAQMVIQRIPYVELIHSRELDNNTSRNFNGFGSSDAPDEEEGE